MRAVLDPNILISALISRDGAPARVLRAWVDGHFELVVSPSLLDELERALGYRKLQRYVAPEDALAFVEWVRTTADLTRDADTEPPVRSADPGDDYLLALASREQAHLVTGDKHLLVLAETGIPIHTASVFLALLVEREA